MATSARRDIELALSVTTNNAESIVDLKNDVAQLAKEGGAAAPEFQKLAGALDKLATEAENLSVLNDVAADLERAAQAQADAAAKAAALAEQYAKLEAATRSASASEREAKAALDAKKRAVQEASDDIKLLRATTDDTSNTNRAYIASLRELVVKQVELKSEVRELKVAYDGTKAATTSAKAAQTELGTALKKVGTEVRDTVAEMASLNGVADRAKAALAGLGVSSDDLASAQAQTTVELTKTKKAISDLVAAQAAAAAAATQQATALKEADDAQRRVAASAKQAGDAIANALGAVGVRSVQQIKAEIASTKAALDLLKSTGALTGAEISSAAATAANKIGTLEREIRGATNALTLADRAASLFQNSMGQFAAGNLIADGIGFLVNKVKELGAEFFTVNLSAQRFAKALKQVYGDTGIAASQFEFLRKTANESGVSVSALSDDFIRFSAATKSSNIPIETTNALFTQLTRAAGLLGLTNEQVTGTLNALGQMASKGVVSMEELRQQLGDRLPGALSIAANGLGVTEAKLIDMVSSGNLATNVFFPAFEKGLRETLGGGTEQINGFIQGWNRLQNAIVATAQKASDTTLFTNLGLVFDALAKNINAVATGVVLLGERFLALKAIDMVASFVRNAAATDKAATSIATQTAAVDKAIVSTTADTVATNINTTAKERNAAAMTGLAAGLAGISTKADANRAAYTALSAELAATSGRTATLATASTGLSLAQRASATASGVASTAMGVLGGAASLAGTAVRGFTALLGGLPGLAILVALNVRELGTAIGESAAKFMGWGKVLAENEKQIAALAAEEKRVADQRRQLNAEQDLASLKAAEDATAALKQADLVIISGEKELKALEQKATATKALSALQGENAASMGAVLVASQNVLAGEEKLLAVKTLALEAAKQEILAISGVVGANGQLTQAQTENLAKLNETLVARQAEVDKMREQVREQAIEVAGRRVASEAIKDNSERIDELALSYQSAKDKLSILQSSGVASLDAIARAEIDAAAAGKILADAQDDVNKKLEALNITARASAQVLEIKLNAEKANYKAMEDSARAVGDYTLALHANIEQKKIDIKLIEAKVGAMVAEAKGIIAVSNAQLVELEVAGKLDPVKKAQLQASIAVAEAKLIEAKALGATTAAIETQITALRNGSAALSGFASNSNSASSATDNLTGSINTQTTALERNNGELERNISNKEKALDLKDRQLRLDQREGTTLVGKSISQVPTFSSEAEALSWKADNDESVGKMTGLDTPEAQAVRSWKESEYKAELENAIAKDRAKRTVQLTESGMDFTSARATAEREAITLRNGAPKPSSAEGFNTSPSTTSSNKTYTVNVNLGGTATTINTSSDADAQKLISLLQRAKLSS